MMFSTLNLFLIEPPFIYIGAWPRICNLDLICSNAKHSICDHKGGSRSCAPPFAPVAKEKKCIAPERAIIFVPRLARLPTGYRPPARSLGFPTRYRIEKPFSWINTYLGSCPPNGFLYDCVHTLMVVPAGNVAAPAPPL